MDLGVQLKDLFWQGPGASHRSHLPHVSTCNCRWRQQKKGCCLIARGLARAEITNFLIQMTGYMAACSGSTATTGVRNHRYCRSSITTNNLKQRLSQVERCSWDLLFPLEISVSIDGTSSAYYFLHFPSYTAFPASKAFGLRNELLQGKRP